MNTTTLPQLQQRFMDRLLSVLGEGITEDIISGRMPEGVGLRIYGNAYGARLREALEHDHPALGVYLGDALWGRLCSGYIAEHPSHHRSLRDFGTDLPAWLERAEPFRRHPQITELAGFERRLLDSFDAADDTQTDWVSLLAIPGLDWPGLSIRFHPSLALHRTAYNSVEIWSAIKGGVAPPPVGTATSTHWVLWRDRDRVSSFRSVCLVERAALAYCMSNRSFAGLCEVLLAWHPEEAVPGVAIGYLQAWSSEGLVSEWMCLPN